MQSIPTAERHSDGSDPAQPDDYPVTTEPFSRPIPRIVSRVTTWSDGTVHIERPGEPAQVVASLSGGA